MSDDKQNARDALDALSRIVGEQVHAALPPNIRIVMHFVDVSNGVVSMCMNVPREIASTMMRDALVRLESEKTAATEKGN